MEKRMKRSRTWRRAAASALCLSAAMVPSAGAEDARTSTVRRTRGSTIGASLSAYTDCVQRVLDVSADSTSERTKIDGTRVDGETLLTHVSLLEMDMCTGASARFTAQWSDLDGVSWDTRAGTGSMSISRPVEVERCSQVEVGVECATHGELLDLNVQWTANGDSFEHTFATREAVNGVVHKTRGRGEIVSMDVVYSVKLDGMQLSVPRSFADMLKNRSATVTISPL